MYKVKVITFAIFFSALVFNLFAQTIADIHVEEFEKITKVEERSGIKDPFAPTKQSLKNLSIQDVQLFGIIHNKEEAYALVDGFMVKPGDMMGGYKIMTITADSIVVRKLDDVKTIRLAGGL